MIVGAVVLSSSPFARVVVDGAVDEVGARQAGDKCVVDFRLNGADAIGLLGPHRVCHVGGARVGVIIRPVKVAVGIEVGGDVAAHCGRRHVGVPFVAR